MDVAELRNTSEITVEQETLFDEAVRRYGPRCLWNCKPSRTPLGLRTVAEKLKAHGNMEAWRMALRIEDTFRG